MTSSIPITTSSRWSELPPPLDLSNELVVRIDSADVRQAACDLATMLGASVDDAVAFAIQAQLHRERAPAPSAERRLQAIHEFVSTLANVPVADEPRLR